MKKAISKVIDYAVLACFGIDMLIAVAGISLHDYIEKRRYFTPSEYQKNTDILYQAGHINEQGL